MQTGGVDVASAIRTTASRESMLRTAVSGAIKQAAHMPSAWNASSQAPPGTIIAGVADALGIEETRAVLMTRAVVASDLRGRLLEVRLSRCLAFELLNRHGQVNRIP